MFDLSKPTPSSGAKGGGDEEALPPPRPDYTAIEVNLQAAIDTVHLARHYMLRSPEKDKGAIVITASCSSVWPTYWAPIYSASKCKLFRLFFQLQTLVCVGPKKKHNCIILQTLGPKRKEKNKKFCVDAHPLDFS